MVCRLCEVQSSHLSLEGVNEYSTLRKEVESENERRFYTCSILWIKPEGQSSRD